LLIDAHVHIALNNLFTRKQWEASSLEQKYEWVRKIIRHYKKHGINVLRDGGDGIFASKIARDIAQEEGVIYKTPIYALYKRGNYGSFIGRAIDDMKSFKKEFKTLLDNKVDHLKIILTGIVNFKSYGDAGQTTFTLEELKYMVEIARFHNIPVMVHANGREGVGRAIRAGVNTIEHGYLITEAELYGMAERNIIWVPTLSPLGNILDSKDCRFEEEMSVIKRVYDEQIENIRKAVEIGVKVALGSDSGAYRVYHGSGLLSEIEHFKRAGLKIEEIEKMCFENGAEALGLKCNK
jgi:imidazolonepropionase-like amidohydrolase